MVKWPKSPWWWCCTDALGIYLGERTSESIVSAEEAKIHDVQCS